MYMCLLSYTIFPAGKVTITDFLVHILHMMYSLSPATTNVTTVAMATEQRAFDPVLLISHLLKEVASGNALCREVLCNVRKGGGEGKGGRKGEGRERGMKRGRERGREGGRRGGRREGGGREGGWREGGRKGRERGGQERRKGGRKRGKEPRGEGKWKEEKKGRPDNKYATYLHNKKMPVPCFLQDVFISTLTPTLNCAMGSTTVSSRASFG